eukprot:ANDGO_05830.mRNA.1 Phosphoglycolate phosphatase 2
MSIPKDLVLSHDVFLFDLDGVLWRGHSVIDGAPQTVAHLLSIGKLVLYVTNNSGRTRSATAAALRSQGFPVLSDEDVICSAALVPWYLKSVDFDGKVFAITAGGIADELRMAGYTVETEPTILQPGHHGRRTYDCVAVGYDAAFSYAKLAQAAHELRLGAIFVASNGDLTYPSVSVDSATGTEVPLLLPGAGSLVAAVAAAAEREAPDVILGKPHQAMLNAAMDRIRRWASEKGLVEEVRKDRIVMVGDRLDTDIAFGRNGGIHTLMVLTGVATREDAAASSPAEAPHFICSSVSDLLHLEEEEERQHQQEDLHRLTE